MAKEKWFQEIVERAKKLGLKAGIKKKYSLRKNLAIGLLYIKERFPNITLPKAILKLGRRALAVANVTKDTETKKKFRKLAEVCFKLYEKLKNKETKLTNKVIKAIAKKV